MPIRILSLPRLSIPHEVHDHGSPSPGPTVPASGPQAMVLASWVSIGGAGPAKFLAFSKAERQVESPTLPHTEVVGRGVARNLL